MKQTTTKGAEKMSATQKKYNENLRQIRRLQIRISNRQDTNASTRNALDRRLNNDRLLLAKLAEEEDVA